MLKSSRNTVSLDRPIDGDASDGPETTMGDNLARDIDPESESGMDSEMKRLVQTFHLYVKASDFLTHVWRAQDFPYCLVQTNPQIIIVIVAEALIQCLRLL